MQIIQIDAAAIPKGDMDFLARGVLAGIGDFFDDPKNQADYERWLAERKQKQAKTDKCTEVIA